MAKENELWGYTRIRDAMENLGHEISRDTVANILKENGIEPAPERGTRTTWADFLKRHWDARTLWLTEYRPAGLYDAATLELLPPLPAGMLPLALNPDWRE